LSTTTDAASSQSGFSTSTVATRASSASRTFASATAFVKMIPSTRRASSVSTPWRSRSASSRELKISTFARGLPRSRSQVATPRLRPPDPHGPPAHAEFAYVRT
jgi:hypothetical protein